MAKLAPAPIEYRHVVFPDIEEADVHAPVVAQQSPASIRAIECDDELSGDEHSSVRWLFERAGLQLADYRPETVKRRLPACMRALRVGSMNEVCQAVRWHPELLHTAMSALVIGVTSFFRDSQVFQAIEALVFPQLFANHPSLRICSVGCSDGSELYSVAMLLAHRGRLANSTLRGIDCRPDAIARAREGRFDPDCFKTVQPELLRRCFSFDGDSWTARLILQHQIEWCVANALTAPKDLQTFDLVLCRNMAIYLQNSATSQLWDHIARLLKPGAFLVLGKAERPSGIIDLKPVAPCIYQMQRS